MKIDLMQKITDLDGTVMKLHTGFNDDKSPILEEATLKRVIVQALWNPLQGDDNLSAEKKLKHHELARMAHGGDVVNLTAEEATLIKERVNKAYAHIGIVAGAHRLIETGAKKAGRQSEPAANAP